MSRKGYIDVTIKEAEILIEQGEVVIIDVRTLEEYQQEHIPNAKLYPLENIERWARRLNPSKKYLLVCNSARRTAIAAEFLAAHGFRNMYNMLGGMNEWEGDVVE